MTSQQNPKEEKTGETGHTLWLKACGCARDPKDTFGPQEAVTRAEFLIKRPWLAACQKCERTQRIISVDIDISPEAQQAVEEQLLSCLSYFTEEEVSTMARLIADKNTAGLLDLLRSKEGFFLKLDQFQGLYKRDLSEVDAGLLMAHTPEVSKEANNIKIPQEHKSVESAFMFGPWPGTLQGLIELLRDMYNSCRVRAALARAGTQAEGFCGCVCVCVCANLCLSLPRFSFPLSLFLSLLIDREGRYSYLLEKEEVADSYRAASRARSKPREASEPY